VRYIKLHNSRLYGRLYKMVIGSGRLNFNALASLDAKIESPGALDGRQTNLA